MAAIAYIFGGLGLELVGGWYAESCGFENLIYATITTVEELLEMLGIIIFIDALLQYIQSHIKFVPISVQEK